MVCNTNISKVQIGNKEPVSGSFLTIFLFILAYGLVYFISMLGIKLYLRVKRYLSAYNDYCEVSVEGACINIKLIIGNRESATGSLFLI